jgi:hypothetical protein
MAWILLGEKKGSHPIANQVDEGMGRPREGSGLIG